ncbi:hypothetical protein [Imhoffiella purpurea]|uniref:Uncharacterized protein n=1 Tax=Imhoffiella purpurea TaxID=1249627 RepID=W9V2Q4_9GAMM|nr:hypothetical protein [Imhoffiella purpurea]EXJ13614.1 hypothetical protein D779_3506 [Imhoffiella purpurea]
MKAKRLALVLSAIAVAGSLAFPSMASAYGGRGWDHYDRGDRWESPAPRHHEDHHRHRHHHKGNRRIYVYDHHRRPYPFYKKRWPRHHRRDVTVIYRY